MTDAGPWLLEKLGKHHDRSAFSSGQPSLDEFLKRFAGQNARSGVSQTYVAVRPGERVVLGYFSISAGVVEPASPSEEQRSRLPRHSIPVAHLGRLAVDRSVRGQGLGERLLIAALARIVLAADAIGIHAVEVVALDGQAKSFYRKYGFVELQDDPLHLYLPMKTVREIGLG